MQSRSALKIIFRSRLVVDPVLGTFVSDYVRSNRRKAGGMWGSFEHLAFPSSDGEIAATSNRENGPIKYG